MGAIGSPSKMRHAVLVASQVLFVQLASGNVGTAQHMTSCIFGDSGKHCSAEVNRMASEFYESQDSVPDVSVLAEMFGDAEQVTRMCVNTSAEQGCIPRLKAATLDFYSAVAANSGADSACQPTAEGASAASAGVGVISLLADFACLKNEAGESCPVAVVQAMKSGGVEDLASRAVLGASEGQEPTLPDYNLANMKTACQAFYDAGCCSASFFQLLPTLSALVCRSNSMLDGLLKALPELCKLPAAMHGIGKSLPASCDGFAGDSYASFVPASENCPTPGSPSFWADLGGSCAAPSTSSCPTTACELGCLSAAALADIQEEQGAANDAPAPGPTEDQDSGSGSGSGSDADLGLVLAVVGVTCACVVLIGAATVVAIKYNRRRARFGDSASAFARLGHRFTNPDKASILHGREEASLDGSQVQIELEAMDAPFDVNRPSSLPQ
mmetsp:Transcript_462/g.954  ORF Transcript_462/g.954 Transcript_462/m.954 type:complete len:442 (+) Transcript_462:287-1612(+)